MLDLVLIKTSLTLDQMLILISNIGLDIMLFHYKLITLMVHFLVQVVLSLLLNQTDLNKFGMILDQEKIYFILVGDPFLLRDTLRLGTFSGSEQITIMLQVGLKFKD